MTADGHRGYIHLPLNIVTGCQYANDRDLCGPAVVFALFIDVTWFQRRHFVDDARRVAY